jgi:glycerol kinase
MKVILALDAGTTNVKAILVDRMANVLARSSIPLSGLGAAFAAGLGCGFWPSTNEVAKVVAPHDAFYPGLEESERNRLVRRWHGAVASVKAYGLTQ